MSERSEFLIFGRRLHNALRHAIEDGDGRSDSEWMLKERPLFEHYSCAMYLTGCLAYLEGKYGKNPWAVSKVTHTDFNEFIHQLSVKKPKFKQMKVSEEGLEALVCIRNAIVHNRGDLSLNRETGSLEKVQAASIQSVSLKGPLVTLISNRSMDFMEFVRMSFLAVSMYHGDG